MTDEIVTIGRNMSLESTQSRPALPSPWATCKLRALGIDFEFQNASAEFRHAMATRLDPLLSEIATATIESRKRQKRRSLDYFDLLEVAAQGTLLPGDYINSREGGVATELALMIAEGHLDYRPVIELNSFRWLRERKTWVEFARESGALPESQSVVHIASRGWRRVAGAKLRRVFSIDMGSMNGAPEKYDWSQVILRGLLVHVHADIEIYLETGFFGIARCQRPACGSFFKVKRMGRRQRFCSDYCRVTASRE